MNFGSIFGSAFTLAMTSALSSAEERLVGGFVLFMNSRTGPPCPNIMNDSSLLMSKSEKSVIVNEKHTLKMETYRRILLPTSSSD